MVARRMFDEHTAFAGGYIYMKTDKQYYYAGDIVYGKIYLRVVDKPAEKMDVRIKGVEKVEWFRYDLKGGLDSDDDEHAEENFDKTFLDYKKKHIDFRQTCFHFQ